MDIYQTPPPSPTPGSYEPILDIQQNRVDPQYIAGGKRTEHKQQVGGRSMPTHRHAPRFQHTLLHVIGCTPLHIGTCRRDISTDWEAPASLSPLSDFTSESYQALSPEHLRDTMSVPLTATIQ